MTAFMHSPFVAAVQNALDADADRMQDIAQHGYGPEHADWLWANTVELSENPGDWPQEFRELWCSLLEQHIGAAADLRHTTQPE